MKRMNLAVVGTGPIAASMVQAAHEVDGAAAYAVYSRSYEKGRAFAEKNQIDWVYTDFEEMLKDENVDFVYLASPNSLHYSQAKDVIKARKNVIVEKPFCSNRKQAADLIARAKRNNVWIFEAITVPHKKNYQLLKEKIRELGKIKEVQCTYLQYSRKYQELLEGKQPNVFTLQYSGGSLLDLNVYNIHFVIGLFGKPDRVSYICRKYKNGVDLGGTVSMEYDGMNVSALAGKDLSGENRVLISGENGYIVVHGGSNGPKPFTVCIDGNEEFFDEDGGTSWLYDELNDFYHYYDEDNREMMKSLLDLSDLAMWVVDEAKRSAGIVFEEDK